MTTPQIPFRTIPYLLVVALLSSCGALQDTASVPDDVYYSDSNNYVLLADNRAPSKPVSYDERSSDSDSYYDPEEAQQINRNYYDMTYRDPHYYNTGRFGWNQQVGMGIGMGFGRPGFGGVFNTGSYWGGGSSFYGYDPFLNGGFNSGFGGLYGNPNFGGYNPNWMYGGYNPYGWNGMGGFADPFYGNWYGPGYFGPGGSFYCPSFVYGNGIAAGNSVYYGQRGSMNGMSNAGNNTNYGASRTVLNNPVGLLRPPSDNTGGSSRTIRTSPNRIIRTGPTDYTRTNGQGEKKPGRLTPPTRRERPTRTTPSIPNRGSGASPSRSTGRSGGQRRR